MRWRVGRVAALALCLMGWPADGLACSLLIGNPTEIDEEEYVFIGRVVRPVARPGCVEAGDECWGVVVSLVDEIQLPVRSPTYAVFPFGLATQCARVPAGGELIRERYPPGTEVRVIAKAPAEGVMPGAVDSALLRHLEVSAYSVGQLAVNSGELRSTKSGVVRFEDLPVTFSRRGLQSFEYRKELVRLRTAAGSEERLEILRRLAHYQDFRHRNVYRGFLRRHLEDEAQIESLLRYHDEHIVPRW